jgi:hypothetical protein
VKKPRTLPRIAYDAFWGKRAEVQVFPFKACAQEWKDAVNAILQEAAKAICPDCEVGHPVQRDEDDFYHGDDPHHMSWCGATRIHRLKSR